MRDRGTDPDEGAATGDAFWGQVCMYGGLLICIVARPQGLTSNNGISYYGTYWQTFVPYAFALLGGALFTRRALRTLALAVAPLPGRLRLDSRHLGDSFAALLVAITLTPYTFGSFFDWVHTLVSALLFVLQLLLSVHLVRCTDGGAAGLLFLVTELTGGIIAARYVIPRRGFLLHGQILFQFGFGALLVRTAALLQPARVAPSSAT